MSIRTVAAKFKELCEQGKNFEAMRTLYADDVVSIESDGAQTAGQIAVIHKSEVGRESKTIDSEKVHGPFFNAANPDQFAVYFAFGVTLKATGNRITADEIAVYTVNKDDKITREQFFNDWER